MKTKLIALLAFIAVAHPAHSQFLLNAGESYSYEFLSLGTPTPIGSGPTGVTFTPIFSGFSLGENILMEAFEDNTSQTPWGSATYNPQSPGGTGLSSGIHWSDFQGVVRITVVSGSMTLESMNFLREGPIPNGGGYGRYSLQVIPTAVPEPGTWSLLGLAGLAALGWRARRK